ncbi:hypothetical protein DL93DRAFT_2082081 [Clavulina sp. PMI_390]|nr:hypothetical protein DL93DRAFT_2082081 [Clavulina sp. PMI_390]
MDSSLLAEFDPILRNTTVVPSTPKRTDTTNQDDALTLSAFFNRVNNVPPTEPPPPNNRGSLIDFSFNFGDIKSKIMKLSPAKKSAPKGATSSSTDAENIPPNTGATQLSPRKQRPDHPPASPFKSVRLPAETPKGLRGRRSSLDISQLTRDLKQTLGAENMSFDILKDEVSFLTNLGEEGVSILAKRQPVELSSNR